jgi:23S rRNA G2445 N2-methylase RlmL
MAQVDYFGTFGLHDATHNVNGGVVAIEKRSCCYYTNLVSRCISHIVFGV